MTLILRDTFTGGNDTDIAARTPDGGGSGPLALGTWAKAYSVDGTDTLDIASGACVPPVGTQATTLYVVTGHGLADADYQVAATFSTNLASGGGAPVQVGLRVDAATGDGYWAELAAFDGFWLLTLYRVSGGAFSQLAQDNTTAVASLPAGDHVLTLSASGTALTATIDALATITATDATYSTTGEPGLGANNTDPQVEILLSQFDVDDEPGATPTAPVGPGPLDVLARDLFTGGNDADIDGRVPDGGGDPALSGGTWAAHPASSGAIAIVGGVAVKTGSGVGVDTLGPYTYECAQGARAVVRFPNADGGAVGDPFVVRWQYRITGNNGDAAAGHPPITPVTGFCDELTDGDEVAGVTFDGLTLWPSGQPKTFTLDAFAAVSGGDPGSLAERVVRFFTTAYLPSGAHTWPDAAVGWSYPDGPPIGAIGLGSETGTLDGFWGVGGSGDDNYVYGGGRATPQAGDGTPVVSTATSVGLALLLGNGVPFNNGDPATDDGATGRFAFTWDEVTVDEGTGFVVGTPAADPNEYAYAELLVKQDGAADTGYRFGMDFTHATALDTPSRTFWLTERSAGVETTLRTAVGYDGAHDTDYTLELVAAPDDVTGNLRLWAAIDGVVLWTFDLVADLATETGSTVALHTTGEVGLALYDQGEAGTEVSCSRFEALSGPGGDNGGGGGGGEPPVVGGLWVYRDGDWRLTTLAPRARGDYRTPLAASVYYRGAYRAILLDDDAVGDPGVDSSPGVGCLDPATLDPGPLDPLTGRFFGLGNLPVSLLGPLFTGTQEALGSWTPGDCTTAGAGGNAVIGAQGGYDKFKTNGRWDRAKYQAWILSVVVPMLAALQAATTAGSFFGFSMLDDFASSALWGTGGIPLGDITSLLVWLKGLLPDIRIGIRGLPSQFAANYGFDFYNAQYKGWMGMTAADFRSREQGLAISRSAYIILSLNYLSGGDGSSGFQTNDGTMLSGRSEMSPAEVVSYSAALFTDGTNLAGSSGYSYSPVFLGRTGMMAALGTARNTLAALPPL